MDISDCRIINHTSVHQQSLEATRFGSSLLCEYSSKIPSDLGRRRLDLDLLNMLRYCAFDHKQSCITEGGRVSGANTSGSPALFYRAESCRSQLLLAVSRSFSLNSLYVYLTSDNAIVRCGPKIRTRYYRTMLWLTKGTHD